MSKYKLLAIIGFTVHTLLIVPSVLATGIGDCTIRLNSIDNVAYGGGYVNNLEIWIMNDTPLYGLSMGFRISSTVPLTFLPHGTRPSVNPIVQIHNDAIGKLDLGGGISVMNRLDGVSPDTFAISGVASSQPLPANMSSRVCYTLQFTIASSGSFTNGISIDNIFVPPSITWTFAEQVSSYAPLYGGKANTSSSNPSAPALTFDIVAPPAQNGDVNCDGIRNISDAVYLINWIFAGGPAPCAN